MTSWLFGKKPEKTPEELEEIRRTFAARYDHFRLLIQANTRAHELMAELEEALRGFKPYGMHYVRTLCTRISTSIFQMVRHLNELDHGSYARLLTVFQEIQDEIMPHIEPKEFDVQDQPVVLDLADVRKEHADLCGPKMSMLGEAGSQLGLTIPVGFVVTTAAYRTLMHSRGLAMEIDRIIQAADLEDRSNMALVSSKVMQLIIDSPVPEDLGHDIMSAYDSLALQVDGDLLLAVRSSALGEDIEGSAFAGQYRTVLNVDRSTLLDAYKEVVASKYSVQAMAYRMSRGIKEEDVAMSVGCMRMVDARSSGVAYSRSPVNIRDESVSIHSVWGLPRAVVDGSAETDEFVVNRADPMEVVERHVVEKTEKYVCAPETGVCRMDVLEDDRSEPSLSDEESLLVARQAIRIEEYFGSPRILSGL